MNQLYVCIYHLFKRFPSHWGHHGALSRVPCATVGSLFTSLSSSHTALSSFPEEPCSASNSISFYYSSGREHPLLFPGFSVHSLISLPFSTFPMPFLLSNFSSFIFPFLLLCFLFFFLLSPQSSPLGCKMNPLKRYGKRIGRGAIERKSCILLFIGKKKKKTQPPLKQQFFFAL